MKRLARHAVLATAVLAVGAPVPVLAQAPVGALYSIVLPAGQFGSDQFTDAIVNSLTAASKFCGGLGKQYQVDCLAERIGQMASEVPTDSDYAEVRSVLQDTSKKMEQLARSNRDRAAPRRAAQSGGSNPIRTSRPLTPINQASVASVNQQAAAILQQAETLLLRSPNDQKGKKLHYARIADALGSNKALLRSA